MKLKDNKGFAGVDAAVAIVVLLVFVSFIASLFLNLGNSAKKIYRKATATILAIEVIEAMKKTEFDTLNDNVITQKSMTASEIEILTGKTIEIPKGYTIKISIENPKEDAEIGQLIKIIKSEVSYLQNKKE